MVFNSQSTNDLGKDRASDSRGAARPGRLRDCAHARCRISAYVGLVFRRRDKC